MAFELIRDLLAVPFGARARNISVGISVGAIGTAAQWDVNRFDASKSKRWLSLRRDFVMRIGSEASQTYYMDGPARRPNSSRYSVCRSFSLSCHSKLNFQPAGRGDLSLHESQYCFLNTS